MWSCKVAILILNMYNTQQRKVLPTYCRALATGVHAEYLFLTLLGREYLSTSYLALQHTCCTAYSLIDSTSSTACAPWAPRRALDAAGACLRQEICRPYMTSTRASRARFESYCHVSRGAFHKQHATYGSNSWSL